MKNPFIIPTAMICATILAGIWMLKPPSKPPEPPDISINVAADNGNIVVVKQHLAAGTNVNTKDDKEQTPLHRAARRGYKKVAELLIANDAEVNAKNEDGNTPLHFAATYNQEGVAELLITKGAEVNAKNGDGVTPLDATYIFNKPLITSETAALLRKHGGKRYYWLK